MSDRIVIDGTCNLLNVVDGECTLKTIVDGVPIPVYVTSNYEYYTGTYEVTPSSETITLSTKDLMMAENITINPVPSQYGRITWNGSTLTVS